MAGIVRLRGGPLQTRPILGLGSTLLDTTYRHVTRPKYLFCICTVHRKTQTSITENHQVQLEKNRLIPDIQSKWIQWSGLFRTKSLFFC